MTIDPSKQERPRSAGLQVIKVLVVVVALGWLFFTGRLEPEHLLAQARHPGWAALGALLTLAPFLITFARLRWVLSATGLEISLLRVVKIGFIGAFFNTFLLGGLGGDVVKLAWLAREAGDGARTAAAVLVDRILALLAVLSLGGVALLLSWGALPASPGLRHLALFILAALGAAAWGGIVGIVSLSRGRRAGALIWACILGFSLFAVGGIALVEPAWGAVEGLRALFVVLGVDALLGLAVLLALPLLLPGGWLGQLLGDRLSLARHLLRFVEALSLMRDHLVRLGLLLILSMASQSITVLALYCFSRAIEAPPSLTQLFAVAPISMVINAVPVPGGGLGVGEAALATLLELLGTPDQPLRGGAAIFLSWRIWVVLWGLLGLPPFLHRPDQARGMTTP